MAGIARDKREKTINVGDTVVYEGRDYEVESIHTDEATTMLVINPVTMEDEDDGWIEVGDFEVEVAF